MAVLAVAIAAAACGSAQVSSPPAAPSGTAQASGPAPSTPSAVSTETPPAVATAAPTPVPTGGPTPVPVATGAAPAALPVIACQTSDASGEPVGRPPATVRARLDADATAAVRAYFVETGFVVLGPSDAACEALVGANGSFMVTVRREADHEAVISYAGTYSYGEVAMWACGVDAQAAKIIKDDFGFDCAPSPQGEQITRTGAGTAGFTAAPRTAGGLAYTPSDYPTVGELDWNLEETSMGAQVRACALPAGEASLCAVLLGAEVVAPD